MHRSIVEEANLCRGLPFDWQINQNLLSIEPERMGAKAYIAPHHSVDIETIGVVFRYPYNEMYLYLIKEIALIVQPEGRITLARQLMTEGLSVQEIRNSLLALEAL